MKLKNNLQHANVVSGGQNVYIFLCKNNWHTILKKSKMRNIPSLGSLVFRAMQRLVHVP